MLKVVIVVLILISFKSCYIRNNWYSSTSSL